MRARAILKTLISEVNNPNISNSGAAIRASQDAQTLFKEEADALSKPSPEAKIPRVGQSGEDEKRDFRGVGKGNSSGKAPGKKTDKSPDASPQKT